jgi:hypothetical protein
VIARKMPSREIEPEEQERLIKESDVNTPMAFWEKPPVKQLMQVEMAGKIAQSCRNCLARRDS